MAKKFLVLLLLVFTGIVFNFTSCAERQLTEGWHGNQFYIRATGLPGDDMEHPRQRIAAARRAAKLDLAYKLIENFKGSKIEGAAGTKDFKLTGMAVAQELKAMITMGDVSVVKETVDEDQSVEIMFSVSKKAINKLGFKQ